MGIRLKEHQRLLRQRVDEVLHYMWDPIGISGIPEARDEYDSYVPRVFGLLIQESEVGEIVAELNQIESVAMGITTSQKSRKRNEEISEILISWMEIIQDRDNYHTE